MSGKDAAMIGYLVEMDLVRMGKHQYAAKYPDRGELLTQEDLRIVLDRTYSRVRQIRDELGKKYYPLMAMLDAFKSKYVTLESTNT